MLEIATAFHMKAPNYGKKDPFSSGGKGPQGSLRVCWLSSVCPLCFFMSDVLWHWVGKPSVKSSGNMGGTHFRALKASIEAPL